MARAALRRLPGFAFEVPAPLHDEVLPRMDVAVFAGFAASGPVGIPVPVEDAAQFHAVFGADAPLAWDVQRGRTLYAQLAPAVRSFFANGGRRCWVIRLAGAAACNAVPVPGVAALDDHGTLNPLQLSARSPGSWSDGVAVSATVTAQRFGVLAWDGAARGLELIGAGDVAIGAGDLLRLTWRDAGIELYLGVASATMLERERGGRGRTRWRVEGSIAAGGEAWFATARVPALSVGTARWAEHTGDAWLDLSSPPSPLHGDADIVLRLDTAAADAPRAGEIVVAQFGTDELLLAVDSVSGEHGPTSPPGTGVALRGRARWRTSAIALPAFPAVHLLQLDLWVRDELSRLQRVEALGMAAAHPRHVQRLPTDDAVYGPESASVRAHWADVVVPRIAVAGTARQQLCIPLGAGTLPAHYLPVRRAAASRLQRDGLASFDLSLFTDPDLEQSLTRTLAGDSEYMRFMQEPPREPAGIHAALPIEEATLIAVPDASQPGWLRYETEPPPAPAASPRARERAADDFVDCAALLVDAPVLRAAVVADNAIALEWTAGAGAGPFVVQEATLRDWSDATEAWAGPERATILSWRAPGDYYYRVRGVGAQPTDWSEPVSVRLAPGGGWRARRDDEYGDDVLLAVHRLLLRIAAARRDVMAVLSLPEHYREDDAIAYVRELGAPAAAASAGVQPLTGEQDALGFAALYHGWLHVRDNNVLRTITPDGAACGVLARRARERGAWIAPANEPLRDVVALVQPAASTRWQELQQVQINVLRQQPQGFMVLCADTLARDEDVRPINVRRLLILLRRVATRLGATYVFEPNDDTLRRMVQRGFEQLLSDLFRRGAFAGRTIAQAFQVVTDVSVNTRSSVDQGRFIVELRVAPARPLVFVVLRLVQTGDRVQLAGD